MEPNYKHLQMVVLDKHHRQFGRGDVVAFWCEDLSCVLVKRIVACPGDTVQIFEGTLYVNGEVSEIYSECGCFEYAGVLENLVTLQEGEFALLGDNIAESKDSRYPEVGLISDTQIYGRVVQ